MMLWSRRQFHAVLGDIIRPGQATGARVLVQCVLLVTLCACLSLLAGCPYYAVPPGAVVTTTPASFDRSFSAASGAMHDEGLAITVQDPATGSVVGTLDGSTVTASVRQQADDSVVVQFNSTNARDPTLLERISRGYDRRMGR